jgi:chemotaxis methyl-accepting protein methylase
MGRLFISLNERAWNHLPSALKASRLMRPYGAFLHSLVKAGSVPAQSHGTYFLRNRPELELLTRIAKRKPEGATLTIVVLGCSNGAEVYSVLWRIRSARPDLNIKTQAIDVSSEIIEVAREGCYCDQVWRNLHSSIFERLTESEARALFEGIPTHLKIKSWVKEGVTWLVADARDPKLVAQLGLQDIVIANRFLCHMGSRDAEGCLRNVARLVRPGGNLFVSGVDIDVRTKVAQDLAWIPIRELLEEIHDGDPSLRGGWPWHYWGLEPLDRTRPDWVTRYASVFEL